MNTNINKTGYEGVRQTPSGKYDCNIWICDKCKLKYIGTFNTPQEAYDARQEAKKNMPPRTGTKKGRPDKRHYQRAVLVSADFENIEDPKPELIARWECVNEKCKIKYYTKQQPSQCICGSLVFNYL